MIHPVHPEFMILEPYKNEEEIKVGDLVTLRESSGFASKYSSNNPTWGIGIVSKMYHLASVHWYTISEGRLVGKREWNNSYGIRDIIKVQLISSIQAPQINYKQKQIQIL